MGLLGGADLSDELWPDELRREGLRRLARLWECAHIEGDRLKAKENGNNFQSGRDSKSAFFHAVWLMTHLWMNRR